MMGGVQKIRFCIRGENHAQSNGGSLPELERRSTVAGNATKTFSLANGIAAEEFNALPSLPSPYFTVIRNLPCLQQQEETEWW